jgi:hypothetical protein
MYKVARSSHRPAPFKQRPPARWGIAGLAARRDGAWCLGKFRGSWEKLESDLYGVTPSIGSWAREIRRAVQKTHLRDT